MKLKNSNLVILSGWQKVMIMVHRYNNNINYTQISKKLDMTYSHVTKICKQLEQLGYVTTVVPIEGDSRTKKLSCSDSGLYLGDLLSRTAIKMHEVLMKCN